MAVLTHVYEDDGYDGERNGSQWWFEAWGSGPKKEWLRRSEVGRPPRPYELRRSDYIVIGIRHPNGEVIYRTRNGGLDLDPRIGKRKR